MTILIIEPHALSLIQTLISFCIDSFGEFLNCFSVQSVNCFFFFTEATIRFLKAKLRVMQEEVDRLSQECNKKVRCNKM